MRCRELKILFILIAGLLGLETIWAQDLSEFGRNKVQYENFIFQILKTKHFEIFHYLQDGATQQEVIWILEKWYKNYSTLLNFSYSSPQQIVVYANQPDFQQTNVISGLIPEEVGGVTESLADRIVLPLTGFHQSNEHVMAHELTHAFLFHMYNSSGFQGYAAQLPLWFVEGMAEFFSLGEKDTLTSIWLRDAVFYNKIPSIAALSSEQTYSPYRFGHAAWAYLIGRYGKEKVKPLLDAANEVSLDSAMEKVFATKFEDISVQWQEAVKAKYQPLLVNKDKADAIGQRLITGNAQINIAPALSPNGEYLAFFSQRNLFTIDLYLADAKTGKVIKKLASNNTDSHFDALRFTDSAGTWSPDSKQFAFVVFEKGNNHITIIDVATLKIKEQLPANSDAIYGIDWSPIGDRLVFVGLKESVTNLYEYELNTKTLTPLTNEHYAVMHPTWSPDGQTIAFVTDRKDEEQAEDDAASDSTLTKNTTDIEDAPLLSNNTGDPTSYGSMKLALLDRQTKNISLLYFTESANHTNPQFSPDGRSLFFISDIQGTTDLYRYSFETDSFYKLTNLATGITGLTVLSPALSVSRNTGQMAFSVFEQQAYHIYLFSAANQEGQPWEPDSAQTAEYLQAITLPPWENKPMQSLFPPRTVPEPESLVPVSTRKYFPFLQLVSISQLIAALSFDSSGIHFAAGANMFLQDLLGDNELFLNFLLSSNIKDSQLDVLYRFLKTRWNFGIHLSHLPFIFTDLNSTDTTANTVSILQKRLFQEQIDLLFQYPFSQNRRLEFATGYAFIYYDNQANLISLTDGFINNVQIVNVNDILPPIHLFQNNLAYVGDYSFFGFTEPIAGHRYRFELDPTLGSLFFITLSGDYRYYAFFRPFTLAFQLFHLGRYLNDAESVYLSPFFLGDPDFVRGYNISLLDPNLCTGVSIDQCPHFQKLFGSKLATFRTELRLPILGNSVLGVFNYPYLPLSLALFFDAGIAWTNNAGPVWEISGSTDARVPIFSTGVALRLNLAGILVFQFYVAYPFQSPANGLSFNLLIEPGW